MVFLTFSAGGFSMATDTARSLTINEVAKRLGISVPSVYRLKRKGRFAPTIRGLGKSVRWDADALEAWIRNGGK